MAITTNTVVVGASAAGLACAACLKARGIPYILLEKSGHVAMVWRGHYDRLHLHTSKGLSGLPYLPMPADYPRYPSREQVIQYLETYSLKLDLKPQMNQAVTSVDCVDGEEYHSENVIITTGYANTPHMPTWPAQEEYRGWVLHSSQYKNGELFKNKDVLIVGFGNSGGEIALDLYEHGARPVLSVRHPVNVVPRDLLGIPILAIGIVMSKFPPRIADMFAMPMLALRIGNLKKFGLRKLSYGPNTQMRKYGKIPLLDIGTLALLRKGHAKVYPDIERFTSKGVIFSDGQLLEVDAVILATGYTPNLGAFLKPVDSVTNEYGIPRASGTTTAMQGLYFCGFYVSPTGMLREIGLESQRIADQIATGQLA